MADDADVDAFSSAGVDRLIVAPLGPHPGRARGPGGIRLAFPRMNGARRRGVLPAGPALALSVVALAVVVVSGCGPSSPGAGRRSGRPSPPTTSATVASPPDGPSPSALVDTFVGTGVGGKSVGSIDTFPGADMPFGMLQWSPDTTPDRTSGGGYSSKDSAISGFSLTHMSGPGCPVYGDIPILPTVGGIGSDPAATSAAFSHATEVASPGELRRHRGPTPGARGSWR